MTDRRSTLLRGLDVAQLTGLEIGPLMSPFVAKSEGDIVYVDHADTAALRHKYAADPNVDVKRIVEVDAVWGERTLAECLGGRKMDYVIASHVVEHVPDLVTWLQEIEEVLAPDGELRLAVPDKCFTFDYLREEARFTDVIYAYMMRARRPLPHALLDGVLDVAANVDAWSVHQGIQTHADIQRTFTFEGALAFVRDAQASEKYVDIHCWVVTPRRFAELMERLVSVGLINLSCAHWVDTVPGPFEFYAALRPSTDANDAVASWRRMAETVRAFSSSEVTTGDQPAEGTTSPASQHDALLAEVAWLRGRVAAMEASTSWRLAAPVRTLVGMVRTVSGRGRARNG